MNRKMQFSIDEGTLTKLQEIIDNRVYNGPTFTRRFSTKSWAVRDAVDLLYRFEVEQRSITHPKASNKK